MRRSDQAGLTLLELLIAVSLLSLLAAGILISLRVGLAATGKANARLIDNRRVAGAERILQQEIAGFVPAFAACGATPGSQAAPQTPGVRTPFFDGEPQAMRFVTTYSLHEAWRGLPQIVELLVIPRADGQGVRLVVNEHLYAGPLSAGVFCAGPPLRFTPIQAGPGSFVLADKLAFCRFEYLVPLPPPAIPEWRPNWMVARWPMGVRIDMAPFADDASRLRPVTITQRIEVNRSPEIQYVDH